MAEHADCWFIEGGIPCHHPGELVELAPGRPRRLCRRHCEALKVVLARPGAFRVSWGRTMSERIAEAEQRVEEAARPLEAEGWLHRVERDGGIDWDVDYARYYDDPRVDPDHDFWKTEIGQRVADFQDLTGLLWSLEETRRTYPREEPIVEVTVITA